MPRTLLFAALIILHVLSPYAAAQDESDAWTRMIDLAEAILGDDGVIVSEDKIDALIDFHVDFSRKVLARPIPSQRIVAVKTGLRGFLATAAQRYQGNKRQATLRLLRDLAANRAVFVELLSSDHPAEAIEEQMLAYLARNQTLSYSAPVPISAQVEVDSVNADLEIVVAGIRMVADVGTSGHANKAIDAGETITLNIPLRNRSDKPYRSTSAFLRTTDRFVQHDVSEAIYTERSIVEGETVTFAPGTTIAPRQHFTFTISPACPDTHRISFELLVWDSDHGKFVLPLDLMVYNVGPLDFGTVRIDDDVPGYSNGNANEIIEPGETIEYVLALANRGSVEVEAVTVSLFTTERLVEMKTGYEELHYQFVHPGTERPIPASFVFTLTGSDEQYSSSLALRLLAQGTARGTSYSWLRAELHLVGVSDSYWANKIAAARRSLALGQFEELLQIEQDVVSEEISLREAYRFREDRLLWNKLFAEAKTKLLARRTAAGIGEPLFAIHHKRPEKGNTRAQGDEFLLLQLKMVPYTSYTFRDRYGQEHKISFNERFGGERDANPGTQVGSRIFSLFLTTRCGDAENGIRTLTAVRRKGRNKPTKLTYLDELAVVDLSPIRFIYVCKGRDVWVFLYRLDFGEEGVPSEIRDPVAAFQVYKTR